MGPMIPYDKNNQSSESDEEDNIRHDRFRSERFQEERTKSLKKSREQEESNSYSSRLHSRRHRDRSPPSYYSRDSKSSSSSHRNEARRSNHDRKDQHKAYDSKSDKTSKNVKKYSETGENVKSNESNKKSLSSMLKNFDKDIESKRKNPETAAEIGPAQPFQIMETCKADTEIVTSNLLSDDLVIGPALPPNLRTSSDSSNDKCSIDSNTSEDVKTDLPPALSQETLPASTNQAEGPALPSHLKNRSEDDLNNTSREKEITHANETNDSKTSKPDLPLETIDVFGPALPPVVEKESYGPALPPNFRKENIQGPSLPAGITADQLESLSKEDSEDEDMVGPLPEGKMNMTQFQLDLRASQIKRKLEEDKSGTSTDIKKREEWMLQLPPEKASNLGLGPRSFRMREAPDMSNRSSWTDTPADKLRKMEQALSGEPEPVDTEEMRRTAFIKERDQVMDQMSQLSREEDRPQTLLEMHQKKIKKKKKKEEKDGKKKERRPFDRNIDLQVNRFDEAQKKAIFKKAQLLDTRFSSGESKYL